MKTLRNVTIAGVAGFAMIAAGSVAAPTQANANGWGAALVGIGVATAIVAATTPHPVYAAPVYRACTYQDVLVGYDKYGRPVIQRNRVC